MHAGCVVRCTVSLRDSTFRARIHHATPRCNKTVRPRCGNTVYFATASRAACSCSDRLGYSEAISLRVQGLSASSERTIRMSTYQTKIALCRVSARLVGSKHAGSALTLSFIILWYGLNVGFNLCNKSLFNVFPFPWFVSTVHVVIGAVYCGITYLLGFKDASFQRPITKKEFRTLCGPASMHALGHVAANLSFAAVAISLTHTVKTLEPAFNVVLSKLILGTATPPSVVVSLLPIMVCYVTMLCNVLCHLVQLNSLESERFDGTSTS